jgi:hypothetical protein
LILGYFPVARQGIELNRKKNAEVQFSPEGDRHSRINNFAEMPSGFCLSPDGETKTTHNHCSIELNALTGKT